MPESIFIGKAMNRINMKNIIVTFFLFVFGKSYAQTYSWATTDNIYQNSTGVGLAVDASGNLFVAEAYSDPSMNSGVEIIKYDLNHNIVWKQKIEGICFFNYNLTTDALGSVCYVSGYCGSVIINGVTTP